MTDPAVKLLSDMRRKVNRPRGIPEWVYLDTALISASWDGDSYSSDANYTQIDLSAVFSAPEGIRAVYVEVSIRDSGSAAADTSISLANSGTPTDARTVRCAGLTNDAWRTDFLVVGCDANGDIFRKVNASGVNTADIYLKILGYYL